MKKIYCRPQIKACKLMPERLMTTESDGERSCADSRRSTDFDEEENDLLTSDRVWFDD